MIGLFLSLLLSREERSRVPEVRRRLISSLFGRASNVLMVAVASLVCGTAILARGGSRIGGAIAACEITMLIARCLVIKSFQRCHAADDASSAAEAWLLRFGGLAIGSSVAWGAMCFLCLGYSHDPVLYVLPVLSTVGTAGAVAARNSGVPRLAKTQLAVSLVPIMVGCVMADDAGYRWLLILVPAMAAGLVILIDERNSQLVDLIETQTKLARLSLTDPLTQIPNRRHFDMRLDAVIACSAGAGYHSSLLLIDVDHFKAFNDQWGHLAGDVLLRQIATVLKEGLRGGHDVVARYGGEEFGVLLPRCGLAEAASVGERLKHAVAASCRGPGSYFATISVGAVSWSTCADRDDVLEKADSALYMAKRAGRNRVETASPLIAA